jgi:putative iron-dependent peroxidase
MFVGDPPGNHDRILDFSTAVTGQLFFVPNGEMLDDLGDLGAGATDEIAESERDGDDSLGIGSLRDPS